MLSKPTLVSLALPALNKLTMAERRDVNKCDKVPGEMREHMRKEENKAILKFEQRNLVRVVRRALASFHVVRLRPQIPPLCVGKLDQKQVVGWLDDNDKFARLLEAVDALDESCGKIDHDKHVNALKKFKEVGGFSNLGGGYIPRRLW